MTILRTTLFAAAVASLAASSVAEARTQVFAPRNDEFAGAFALTSSTLLRPGHLYNATRELGEPRATTAGIGRSVWYRHKAGANGRVVVTVALGRMDPAPIQLAVYRGTTLANLVKLGSGGFTGVGNSNATAVVFDAVAGETYMIQVDSAAQDGYFEGNFQIGLAAFGAAGGLPLFVQEPTILREEYYGVQRLLAVNGFKARAAIAPTVETVGGVVTLTATADALDVAGTAWFEIKDDYARDLAKNGIVDGALAVAAKNAATGSALGSGRAGVQLIRDDRYARPKLLVRFDHPGIGTRATEAVTATATVTNTSTSKADGCRFLPSTDAFALRTVALDAAGKPTTEVDRAFPLAPGEVRRFQVSMTGTGDAYEDVTLDCGGYAAVNYDYLARFYAAEQYGLASRILVDTQGVDAFERLAVPARTTGRSVVVKLSNTGEYAGDFMVKVQDDEYQTKADVTAVCESDAAGKCTGPSGTSRTTINLAKGEIGYVTVKLNRGAEPASGFVYFDVESIGSPDTRDAGFGGFEVITK